MNINEDGNGQITMDELKEVLGGCLKDEKDWVEIMKEADLNGDNQVYY